MVTSIQLGPMLVAFLMAMRLLKYYRKVKQNVAGSRLFIRRLTQKKAADAMLHADSAPTP